MALTNEEKSKLIDYLEYPAQEWVITWINQRLNLLPLAETETQIQSLITEITTLQTSRQTFINNNPGKEIDGTTRDAYYRGQAEIDIKKRIKENTRRISTLLNIPVNRKVNNIRGQS